MAIVGWTKALGGGIRGEVREGFSEEVTFELRQM